MSLDETIRKNLEVFIALASKDHGGAYYTQSELSRLTHVGKSLNLPTSLIDEILRGKSVSNAHLLQEVSAKSHALAELKTASMQSQHSEAHRIIYNNSGQVPQSHLEPSTANHQGKASSDYQTSISALQHEVNDLKNATGGEGEVRRVIKPTDKTFRHEDLATDKTTITLVPLKKQFHYDR